MSRLLDGIIQSDLAAIKPVFKPTGVTQVPIGTAYTALATVGSPIADNSTALFGARLWHRTATARRADTFRFYLARSGSTYTLTTDDLATSNSGAAPSIQGTVLGGSPPVTVFQWQAAIVAGALIVYVKQSAAVRYSHVWVWKTEESNA